MLYELALEGTVSTQKYSNNAQVQKLGTHMNAFGLIRCIQYQQNC